MLERSKRMESPVAYVTESVSRSYFCLALCSFGPLSRALVVITGRGIPLHDAFRINCEKGATTENQDADVKYIC